MAVALAALFVALGGSAWAISKGSVKARHIDKNAVRSKHIKRQQVRSSDVRNGNLKAKDIREGTLTASLFDPEALADLQGERGPAGPQGATGAPGPRGPRGPRGFAGPLPASAAVGADDEVLLPQGSFAAVLSTTITTSVGTSRVMASATLDAVSADPNGSANCRIVIDGTAGIRQVSRNGDNIRQNMALGAAAEVEAGEHDVVLECAQGGSGATEVQDRQLLAWAAAA